MKQCHDCPYIHARAGDEVISAMGNGLMEMFPHLEINVNPRNAHCCHDYPLEECQGHIKLMVENKCINEIIKPGTVKVRLL